MKDQSSEKIVNDPFNVPLTSTLFGHRKFEMIPDGNQKKNLKLCNLKSSKGSLSVIYLVATQLGTNLHSLNALI